MSRLTTTAAYRDNRGLFYCRTLSCAALLLISSSETLADRQLLWGDTHLHTSNSPDAYVTGTFTVGPGSAYRFAKGLPVVHPSTRTRVQLASPLDFLVVADHAESMGVLQHAAEGTIPSDNLGFIDKIKVWFTELGLNFLINNPDQLNNLLNMVASESSDVMEAATVTAQLPVPNSELIERSTWLEYVDTADANNEPGRFSAIIGWEWSSMPAGANLHRVIFTNADAAVARQFQPFSTASSNYPEDLWRFLEETAQQTGADFIAIPHNANISRGYMFPAEKNLRGEPIDQAWIDLRTRFETVVEATQTKGDSETDPTLSPEDPFANFERFPYYLMPGAGDYQPGAGDFVRSSLLTGLKMEQRLGSNPYKFGLIGSTDIHTGLSTAEERNFWGKMASDALPQNKSLPAAHIPKFGWAVSASGMAGVWAKENTRQSIFDAFKRREVYATTGPRIAVRVYAGTAFVQGDELTMDFAAASEVGVPMGGELRALPSAPAFLIHAARDPNSASLDRVQMVKGWLAGSDTFERVYDVAWSGDRQADAHGRIPAVPNTVNAATGDYSDEYGAATLSTVWIDPDFDPAHAAFYYLRVLEVPTPRHSTLDAVALDIDPGETGQAVTIQERAYTSPIFYTP